MNARKKVVGHSVLKSGKVFDHPKNTKKASPLPNKIHKKSIPKR